MLNLGGVIIIYTIVPASNEEGSIAQTIGMLLDTKTDKILVVLNGCIDNTFQKIKNICNDKVEIIYFNKPLGLDVPRAMGAYFAYRSGATSFVFVDGDMKGNISSNINDIIIDISKNKTDMSLTDCYSYDYNKGLLARRLIAFRKQLNIELGIYSTIGYALPSHGPHGLSRNFLDTIGFQSLAIPPLSLTMAVKNSLNIRVSTHIPHRDLSSTVKDEYHAKEITKTIIGDCIEALHIFKGEPPKRGFGNVSFLGYHKNRRFDILNMILNNNL